MTRLSFPRRIAAWLALGSVAFNTLWPVLAVASTSVPTLPSEICSATGSRHAGGGTGDDAPGSNVRPAHCTLCHFNPERSAAISCATHVLLSPVAAVAQPAAHFESRRSQAAFHPSAPPRAPPYLS
ncbi:MAG TPA: DUF2946 family protein [Burkholderiales bacterium]